MRVFHGLVGLALLLSAVVQLNDPDPAVWVLLYGLASLVAAMGCAMTHRPPALIAGVLCVMALAWIGTLVPSFGAVTWAELVGDARMLRPEVEVAREAGGLGLVAFWMAVSAVQGQARTG
jgi:hypothetical protein